MSQRFSDEPKRLNQRLFPKDGIQIQAHPPEFSRSAYENAPTPLPPSSESKALSFLLESVKKTRGHGESHRDEAIIFELVDFEIYRSPAGRRAHEFDSLHLFNAIARNFCFNGVVSSSMAEAEFYIEDIPIENISIEGYHDAENPGTEVYIKSRIATKEPHDLWYHLKSPSDDYAPFHRSFLWVSQFGKLAIDYLSSQPDEGVQLAQFREAFHIWLSERFNGNEQYRAWEHKCGITDFRSAFNAYGDFIYNQAYNLPNAKYLLKHPIWGECLKGGRTVIKKQDPPLPKTIATPIVYQCFKKLYFASHLRSIGPEPIVKEAQDRRKKEMGFPTRSSAPQVSELPPVLPAGSRVFQVGDVVGIPPDENGAWKGTKEYLAYVQRVETVASGEQRLFVLWLYRPEDTTILDMLYPFQNELFLSDHCNCSDGTAPLLSSEVRRKYSVYWDPAQSTMNADFVVSRKFVTANCAFVSLKKTDIRCSCREPAPRPHKPASGDTVYITQTKNGTQMLEPVVVEYWDGDKVYVHQLLRLQDLMRCKNLHCDELNRRRNRTAAPNELVWTHVVFAVSASRIRRRCHVRYFPLQQVLEDKIPIPYNRRGNGDYWFITSRSAKRGYLTALEKPPNHMRQGPDPATSSMSRPLKGLSLFSGGGNLDRGLEEGRAVSFTHAVDFSREAVHTQLANNAGKNMQIFYGSVDNYLKLALEGRDIVRIARIGDIDIIAAGSPCPGFSTMQQNPNSEQSLRNASHITSFCSFVDLYRPEYAILENVVSMTNTKLGQEDQKVFSQLVACLVALGYQVNQYIMDAWNYSSCQSRTRLFVTIAAPGLEPIQPPMHTHAHPISVKGRRLGKLPTGEHFGCRERYPTPFPYFSARDAISDLPDIGSGLRQICIPFPDHRMRDCLNDKDRTLMKRIPRTAPAMGYKEAFGLGLLPPSALKNKKDPGRAFRRIPPSGLIPTIMTQLSPQDNRTGNMLHWEQPRPITVMEARRAQGIPDDEVIIGTPAEQWRIIGNGVDRNVSFALGLALRDAVEKNYQQKVNKAPRADFRLTVEKKLIELDIVEQETRVGVNDLARSSGPVMLHSKTVTMKYIRIPIMPSRNGGTDRVNAKDSWAPNGGRATGRQERDREEVNNIGEPRSISDLNPVTKPNSMGEFSSICGSSRGGSSSDEAAVPNTSDGEQLSDECTIVFQTERRRASLGTAPTIPQKRGREETTESSTASVDSRVTKKTRHSGLQAEFAPVRWDKRPEPLLKNSASRSSSA